MEKQARQRQVRRLSSLWFDTWLALALVVGTQGTPEASSPVGTSPVALSCPHPAFDAGPSLRSEREGGALLISLRPRKERDTDGDGVTDRQDACPDTPLQATVDTQGCPTDTDQDGIFDGIDQCANTARGATVDTAGCPRDSDGDGLLDGLDMCPDTDSRALVNEVGCPYDLDGNGVADGLDKCPHTSLEHESDESGCSRVQREEFALPTIRFGFGSTQIKPGSSPALDEVARIIKLTPDLIVEIGGHTDTEGPAKANRAISLRRAEEVKAYLLSLGVPASQLTTKGYGEVHPIASNRDAEGRAKNRRIEFKVLVP